MLHYTASIRFAPWIAVVTMVTADHLEWHGGLDQYVDAKRNLVRFQSESDFAVLNARDPVSSPFSAVTRAQAHWFPSDVANPIELQLRGEHNQLNAQAALVAATLAGVDPERARLAVRDFTGLPHRLQFVRTVRGVQFVNDSIATGPDAATAACNSFPERTVLQIVGGYDKHLDLSSMCRTLAHRCKCVLTIGALAEPLASAIRNERGCEVVIAGTLEIAVYEAFSRASEGDTVLLSPGCASYDQFPNFEHRGERFVKLVNAFE
jgi:UDP-N-acetylmuramoylalanine--D-glutamate ligase